MHGLFNILCHINHIHKILLFLCLHPFIRRLVVMSRRSTSRFRLGDYTFNAHSTLLLPVIHIVLIAFRILFGSIIYMCVCMCVCIYIFLSTVELSKVFISSQKLIPFMSSTRQYPRQYLDWVELTINTNYVKYWTFLRNLILFPWTSKIFHMSRYPRNIRRL
jgi:hypothetical protein